MMDELMKSLDKKPKEKMSEDEIKAKMEVVMELLNMAQDAMGGEVKSGMDEMFAAPQKVEVMADDADGLAEGLDKAQDIVEEIPEMDSDSAAESDEGKVEEPSLAMDADEESDEEDEDKKPKKKLFDLL